MFERDGVKLVVDNISYDFVKGATVDYVEELIRAAFVVSTFISLTTCIYVENDFLAKHFCKSLLQKNLF